MADRTLSREEAARLAGVSTSELKGRERQNKDSAFAESMRRQFEGSRDAPKPEGATSLSPSGVNNIDLTSVDKICATFKEGKLPHGIQQAAINHCLN